MEEKKLNLEFIEVSPLEAGRLWMKTHFKGLEAQEVHFDRNTYMLRIKPVDRTNYLAQASGTLQEMNKQMAQQQQNILQRPEGTFIIALSERELRKMMRLTSKEHMDVGRLKYWSYMKKLLKKRGYISLPDIPVAVTIDFFNNTLTVKPERMPS